MNEHKVYTFNHNRNGGSGQVEYGPYPSECDAKEAFQRHLGYWPNPAVHSHLWVKP